MTDLPAQAPTCRAYRPERGDLPCEPSDPVAFAVTYRSSMGARAGELDNYTPGCYPHCLTEQIQASTATMTVASVEPLASVINDVGPWPTL
ncbi:hypothetical protein [Micromonospora sp. NPDC049107]|uniref:hypothetical protein n=1 Tax=unclassified Micromonospora TaxID=2617518 RepID=UPI003402A4A4